MELPTDPEPDQGSRFLCAGHDIAGYWLGQDSLGQREGRFVSFAAAIACARNEQHSVRGAPIIRAVHPTVPTVPFAPAQPRETVPLHRVAA